MPNPSKYVVKVQGDAALFQTSTPGSPFDFQVKSSNAASLTLDGTSADIRIPSTNTTGNIRVLPGSVSGSLVVGPVAADSIILGGNDKNLTITADNLLYLTSNTSGVILDIASNTTAKVSINGPTAQQYATNLAAGDLVNKYYVDNSLTIPVPISRGGTGATTIGGAAVNLQGSGIDSNSVGFRGIPIKSITSNYATVASDAGITLLHPSTDTASRTLTIASHSSVPYPNGTAITFINDSSSSITIACGNTMVWAGVGTTGSRILAQYGMATAVKISSTRWYIGGAGLS